MMNGSIRHKCRISRVDSVIFPEGVKNQKFQFLALATMKSRKTFSFAAFFISAG